MTLKIGDSISGALFSEDHKYRYSLWRIWDKTKEALLFIGLNPSTASDFKDDPTIIRLVGFAKGWGFGSIYAGNLRAIVSANPEILLKPELFGNISQDVNDQAIKQMSKICSTVLVGWGEWGSKLGSRPDEVIELVGRPLFCLKVNKSGEPCHPLYLPRDSKLIQYFREVKV